MPTTTQRAGMGAIVFDGGCAFRVWAPNAQSVAVAGSFNGWSADADPLAHEGNGYWSGEVAAAAYRDEYKYVISGDGGPLWKNDPYARETTHSNGNSVIIDPRFCWGGQNGYRMPAWNELVIYEMHVGTFHGATSESPGNFDQAISRLGYLRELGVNAVEVMPAQEFPGGYSWGYNPAHIFAVERDYGGPKALRRFIRAAHEHGIAVIFDVVYNHFGPSDLDLWRFDGWNRPGHDGGVYFYDDARRETPWGPRPDYGRGEVRRMIRDNAMFWLDEFHADGLRFDATANIRSTGGNGGEIPDGWGLLQWINNEIDARCPWKISIAEDLRDNAWLTKDSGAGGAGFDTQWDAAFVHPVRRAVIAREDKDRDLYAVRDAICHGYNGNAQQRVIYTESHDEVANGKSRAPEEIWPGDATSWFSRKRSTLGAALVMTSPGIPMIFQGQEFLEDRWFHDDDPLDWHRKDRFAGIVSLYRDLIRLRRNWYDNTRGLRGGHVNVFHVDNSQKLMAMHRWDRGGPGDDVVVVLNFANRTHHNYRIGFPRGGTWWLRFNGDTALYDGQFGAVHAHDTAATPDGRDGLAFSANVAIGPYSALIYSQ